MYCFKSDTWQNQNSYYSYRMPVSVGSYSCTVGFLKAKGLLK